MEHEVVAALHRRLDQAQAQGIRTEGQLRRLRAITNRLVQGVDLARASLGDQAKVLDGALAGAVEAARTMLRP